VRNVVSNMDEDVDGTHRSAQDARDE